MNTFSAWQKIEKDLFEMGRMAIIRFAEEHPHELCSFFAYAWTIVDDEISICIDTLNNALSMARANEQEVIEQRKLMLNGSQSWQNAHYFLTTPPILDYASGVDLFAYPSYEHSLLGGWNTFIASEAFPTGQGKGDNYVEGNVRLVIWKVLERLVMENLFNSLSLAFPCRLGYQFHDQALIVLHILNWPER